MPTLSSSFSSIFNARHHVRHQSCQRSGACTSRAVHHEVAQTKDVYLPLPLGLEPPWIELPLAELGLAPLIPVVPRFDGINHEAQGEGPSPQPDVRTPQSRRDCSTPQSRDQIANDVVRSLSAPRGITELQREQTIQGEAYQARGDKNFIGPDVLGQLDSNDVDQSNGDSRTMGSFTGSGRSLRGSDVRNVHKGKDKDKRKEDDND